VEILSKQEIDSLLGGIASGQIRPQMTDVDADAKIIESHDFRLPHRLSEERLRTLRAIHENFADSFKTYLVSRLQMMVSVGLQNIEQVIYNEYSLGSSGPRCLYIFRIEESSSYAILEYTPELILALVERLLGGSLSEPIEKSGNDIRQITKIEQSIVKGFIQRGITDLQNAWRRLAPLTFRLERYESRADFAQITPSNENVIVMAFDIAIGDKHYRMNVCFPTAAVKDVLEKLEGQEKVTLRGGKSRDSWGPELQKRIEKTELPVGIQLGKASITIQEMMDLEIGDVLRLDTKIGGEVRVLVGGKIKFYAKPGFSNDNYSVKISRKETENISKGEMY